MLKYKWLTSAVLSMTALSITAFSTEENKNGKVVIEPSTFARFVPERKDDFAWENDLIAFRAYGPALRNGAENSGVDCWLKRVDYPIINRWYKQAGEGMSYHEDHGEGLDNYHVGSSAGCGGTALWVDGERMPLETYTHWNIVEQTQNKTVFVLSYEHIIQGKKYKEDKKITIELGKRLYHAQSTFWVDGVIAKNLAIAVGIATHDEKAAVKASEYAGWLAGWETIDEYGLGTAVVVEPSRIKSLEIINSNQVKDKGHAIYIVETDDNGQIDYYSGYGWQKANTITTANKWYEYLNTFSSKQ